MAWEWLVFNAGAVTGTDAKGLMQTGNILTQERPVPFAVFLNSPLRALFDA